MFIWVGGLLPKEYEVKVRNICNFHNCNIRLNNVAFSLPQHISFECKGHLKVIKLIEDKLSEVQPLTSQRNK